MIEAVLFDYGMVLSGPPNPDAWARLLEITGVGEEQFEQAYWAPRHDYDRGRYTGAEYWRAVGQHAGRELGSEEIPALLEWDTALWTEVNEPMVDWAGRLRIAGTKTGVLSNLGDELTAGVQRKMTWIRELQCSIFSHRLGITKPDAAIYRHALDGLGVAAKRVLFVDDRAENCAGGRAVGMEVIEYGAQHAFVAEMERRGWGGLWLNGIDDGD